MEQKNNDSRDLDTSHEIDDSEGALDSTPGAKTEEITPKDLLRFGKDILAIVALLYVLSAICEYFQPGSKIFEAAKTILPPVATLIIGCYFAKS